MGIIMPADAGVHQHGAFVRFDQQANPSNVPARPPGGHGDTVQDMDGHKQIKPQMSQYEYKSGIKNAGEFHHPRFIKFISKSNYQS
jgi:hypothetical protein